MIFLTVGTQLPFDRLVATVDAWAGKQGVTDVFGQIADPGATGFYPGNFRWQSFLPPADFDTCFQEARLVIAHAGMGSIISALTLAKPIVLLPRLAARGEHRNDHQLATARKFQRRPNVWVAMDETGLPEILTRALASGKGGGEGAGNEADQSLILAIRDVVLASGKTSK